MIGKGPGRLMGRRPHLMILGQRGETLAEHLDWIVRPNALDEVVEGFVEALDTLPSFDVLLLERVREDSPVLARLEPRLRERGLLVERVAERTSPYLELPASFEALLASRSRNFRRQWRNSMNRLGRDGDVSFRVVGGDLELDEAFEQLVRLHRARWGEGRGSFRTERYVAFHRRLSRALLDEDSLLLGLLEVDGTPIAARYDFLHAGKVWSFQGGREPALEHGRPGTVAMWLGIAWAIEQGYREYDLLSGAEAYKDRWATGRRALVDVRALRRRPYVRLVRRLKRWSERRGGA